MVIITILAKANPYTVYFDHPIREPKYVRLLSASLFNSWYNLTSGKITLRDKKTGNTRREATFLPGHYTVESIAREFEDALKKDNVELKTNTYTPTGALLLQNNDFMGQYKIEISEELVKLLNIEQNLPWIRFVKKLTSPSTYFVHCDLVDREKNLLNGKPTDVLASFAVRGQPFQMVDYQQESMYTLRDMPSGLIANSLSISVKDEDGNLFNFNELPLKFEIEII